MSDQLAHRDGPVFIGFPFSSMGAAYLAVIGTLAALYRRNHDGCGRRVCTSLVDGALAYNALGWGESDQSVAMLAASGGAWPAPTLLTTPPLPLLPPPLASP